MSKFTELFIKRPVLSSAVSVCLFMAGLFSLHLMPVSLFPKLTTPVVTISTIFPGASAQIVKSHITNRIEAALSGVEGVDYITATSEQSSSTIQIYMHLGYDPKLALASVLSKVDSVSDELPQNALKPTISVSSADDDPAMILAFTSSTMDRRSVAEYLRKSVEPQFESIPGVSIAKVLGRTPAMRLWLDPIKMASRNIAVSDVINAVGASNVISAAGKTDAQDTYFNIRANTDLSDSNNFNNVLIKSQNGGYVKLEDIGAAQVGDRDQEINAYYNGLPAAMVFIQLTPDANPVSVTNAINKVLPKISAGLPNEIKLHQVVDSGRYINQAIYEVLKTLCITALVIIAVLYLFLGTARAILIPLIVIPVSIIGVCLLLFFMGFSINTLTLLAMVLAVGLVVDDAIVVVENIFRHMESGMDTFAAALMGASEIVGPVIAMSITLAAVYLPVALMHGMTAQLFYEFAFSLAGAVVISGFVALTLSPMLSAKCLNKKSLNTPVTRFSEQFVEKLKLHYIKILQKITKHTRIVLGVFVLICMATGVLVYCLPSELAPAEDQGLLIGLSSAPDYTNSNFINSNMLQLANIYQDVPETDSQIVVSGIPTLHKGLSFISLEDWSKRSHTADQLKNIVQSKVNDATGIQTIIINPPSLPEGSDFPLEVVLKSTESYAKLFVTAQQLIGSAWASGKFEFVQTDLNFDQPTLKVVINRNAAEVLGVSMQQISDTLGFMTGETQAQEYSKDGKTYYVIPQIFPKYRYNPKQLNLIYVRTKDGKLVSLSSVAELKRFVEPEHLNEFQKLNSITISGVMKSNYNLSDGVNFFKDQLSSIPDKSILLDYAGATRDYIQQGDSNILLFLAAIGIIFFVLSIQFESYRSPFIILFGTAPLALFSALIVMACSFITLNIYTEIGLLTLIGLISKQGILITEFANKLQKQGYDKYHAVIEAANMRFRPILMTTCAMVLGVLPLVLATGAGSVSRFELGVVVGAGMLFGTALTIILMPAIYVQFSSSLNKS